MDCATYGDSLEELNLENKSFFALDETVCPTERSSARHESPPAPLEKSSAQPLKPVSTPATSANAPERSAGWLEKSLDAPECDSYRVETSPLALEKPPHKPGQPGVGMDLSGWRGK